MKKIFQERKTSKEAILFSRGENEKFSTSSFPRKPSLGSLSLKKKKNV